ncbi:putative molybdenum carrier protein [Thiocystis violacea]|uniref:putative molybdenum carrier protein n=1 Tax=Thiocystis violacea TaxID=13725 RepID=UPI0019032897|nr:putative molybdenum carrier protein [Thiocystis violacea]MBK1721083.1 hypothetical protein [Thiocystis violacea]
MKGVIDQLKRKGKVDEDLYFAKRDNELLAAMHSQRVRPQLGAEIVIVSGGQTGVDRAALDAALALGLPIGGWCPRGRRAEDGAISERYPLLETPAADYRERTLWNLRDSDATLILHAGALTGGTLLTAQLARRGARPLLTRDLATGFDLASTLDWLLTNHVRVLNCAGPRESGLPGIYSQALDGFTRLFAAWTQRTGAG